MKKHLLASLLGLSLLAGTKTFAQQRYVDDVFSSVTKQTEILYDSNRSVNILYGLVPGQLPIITVNLKCDVYQPASDTATKRPVIVVVSTGSFLPPIVNNQATGSKSDSSIVELCTRFAKKGYVVVAANYRQGWNPLTQVEADAKEQLLKATFRAIQDVRNCIRYLRINASVYGIDTSKIIVGGQGTGGYVALALASVNKRSEIESNPKFLRGDFSPMVNIDTLGDWNGSAGVTLPGYPYTFNYGGDPSVSGHAHMVFNYGGAIGDSTWMDASMLPVVSLHSVTDVFAPYRTGNVVVPTTQLTVIPSASGAGALIPYANSLGVNSKINSVVYTDVYTTRAMQASGNVKNLFPFFTPIPGDGAPWEWWDRPTVQAITSANVNGIPVPANGHKADSLSMLTNMTMSVSKGRAYVDTVVGFVSPRIAAQFDLATFQQPTGISEASLTALCSLYPNPAKGELHIALQSAGIAEAKLFDLTGKEAAAAVIAGTSNKASISLAGVKPGLYFVQVKSNDGRTAAKRVVVE